MNRILLAHDRTPGSDRALDRALQLARQWQAELLVVHVLRDEDDEAAARHELLGELKHHEIASQLYLEHGEPAERIAQVARDSGSALLLLGLPRTGLSRLLPGSTLQRLAGCTQLPLLVVRQRTHGAYKRILLACDLSASARHTLQRSLQLFPRAQLELLHAFEPLGDTDDRDLLHQQLQHLRQGPGATFLDACGLDSAQRQCIRLHLRPGAIEPVLAAHLAEHAADLVVLGPHAPGRLRDLLQGDHAASLLDELTCDTLLLEPIR